MSHAPHPDAPGHSAPPTVPPLQGRRFVTDIPVRWGDMDALGHLNNTVYFRLIEEARLQGFTALGAMRAGGDEGMILASVGCDFRRSVVYPATVRVSHEIVRVGRSSLEMRVTLTDRDTPDTCYAEGREVLVWMHYPSGSSRPWPAWLLACDGAPEAAPA